MPTKAERTALVFLSAVVLTGGLVRLARALHGGLKRAPAAEAALATQRRAVDSALSFGAARGGRATGPARGPGAGAKTAPAPRRVAAERASPGVAVVRVEDPPQASAPIDVDRATADELERLPRIGPALAARIVAERDAHGAFGSLAALDERVKGIGPALVKAIEGLVTFSGR